jgi:prohibitin 1
MVYGLVWKDQMDGKNGAYQKNLLLSQSVTEELIQWQAVQKWDGKLPSVTSGATPFIQVK